jgi:uncharacterized iron-regulated membrane protein
MTKLAMRRAWFQVHKWIGLILAILIIPLSVTGAALVWDDALDHGLNPQRYAVSGGAVTDTQAYVDAARAALKPGENIATMSHDEGGPVVIAANVPAKRQANGIQAAGPPARTTLWLDPPSARLLDRASGNSGLIRAMHQIHGSLMIPGAGRAIVGWIGVAMAFSCFTGLWLWWPTVGKWVRGLRWRRHRNLDTNLHHLTGFWVALPLFVLSLTGMWISFPGVFGGGMARGPGGDRGMARPQPLASPHLGIDAVIASAQGVKPGDWQQVTWPTDRKPVWSVALADTQDSVTVDDLTGAAKLAPAPPETTARLMRRIHDGTRMGALWQTIIFLGGLIPALLAITGIIMWWRARGWKAELKARMG